MLGLEAWLAFYFQFLAQILLTFIVFHCVEKLNPVEANQPIKALAFNLSFLTVNLGLVLLLLPQLQPIIVMIRTILHGGLISLPPVESMSLWQLIAWSLSYAVVWDLLQYASHRLLHSVPFLWEIHKFHHKERALSSVSAARKHVFEYAFEDFSIALPTLLIFADPTLPVVAQVILFRFWGFFNHMNFRLNLGLLKVFISGPQFHRIHHSILPEHRNKNFATFFPVIDRIFGTYYGPAVHEFPPTGMSGEADRQDLFYVNIQPIRKWLTLINRSICAYRKTTQTPEIGLAKVAFPEEATISVEKMLTPNTRK